MKQMLNLFQAKKMVRVMTLVAAFFFVGMAGINAQYMGAEEASVTIKSELQTLEDDFNNATTNEVREDIAFKYKYYNGVLEAIASGIEVGNAIQEAAPNNKPSIHSSGLVAFTTDENFKQERQDLVDELDALLAE